MLHPLAAPLLLVLAAPALTQCERFIAENPSPYNPNDVALSGQRLLVGYPVFNLTGSGSVGGSVRVVRDEGQSLTPNGWIVSPSPSPQPFDAFGWRVEAEGPVLMVSAEREDIGAENAGGAYAFVKQPGGWMPTQRLAAPLPRAGARFGFATDLDGDTYVVGAIGDDGLVANSGAAYVFRQVAGSWQLETTLLAPDGADDDRFGWAVAVSGDTIFVGAPKADGNAPDLGATYVFERSGTTWTQVAKLFEPEVVSASSYATALELDGELAVVGGLHFPDPAQSHGAAWIYRRTSAGWQSVQRLESANPGYQANFGFVVELRGTRVYVGRSWSGGSHTIEEWRPYAGSWVRTRRIGAASVSNAGPYYPTSLIADESRVVLTHATGGPAVGSIVVDLDCGLGEPYCLPNAANSTGNSGALGARGSLAVSASDLTLSASGLPPGYAAIGLVGAAPGSTVLAGGAGATLCLSGPQARFHTQAGPIEPDGSFEFQVDLSQLPAPLAVAVQPGETWYFQVAYRDELQGQAVLNLTSALALTFL